jgi:hypothetical protein
MNALPVALRSQAYTGFITREQGRHLFGMYALADAGKTLSEDQALRALQLAREVRSRGNGSLAP